MKIYLLTKLGKTYISETIQKNKPSKTSIVGNSKNDHYCCSLDSKKNIHIIYKNNTNALIYLSGQEEDLKKQTLLQDSEDKYDIQNVKIVSREAAYVFYAAKNPIENSFDLVFHRISEDQSVSPQALLTLPDSDTKYVCQIHNDVLNLFVLNNIDNLYELNRFTFHIPKNTWLGYEPIVNSPTPMFDYSFCFLDSDIHMCYVIENYGYMSLYYSNYNEKSPKITTHTFDIEDHTATKITSHGTKFTCKIFAYNGVLWITYLNQSTLYTCFSSNKGESFSEPIKCTFQNDKIIDFTLCNQDNIICGSEFFGYITNQPFIAVLSQIDIQHILYNSSKNLELKELLSNQLNTSIHEEYIKKLEVQIQNLEQQQNQIIGQYEELRSFTKKVQSEGKKWRNKYSSTSKTHITTEASVNNSEKKTQPMKKIVVDKPPKIRELEDCINDEKIIAVKNNEQLRNFEKILDSANENTENKKKDTIRPSNDNPSTDETDEDFEEMSSD